MAAIIGTFLEGLLSFLSPCVLPLLPLYMSYLAGNNKQEDEDGNVKYNTGKVFLTTIFFVLGICFVLFLLTVSVSFIGKFLEDYKDIISIICGTILIIFGLHETGLIHIDVLDSDSRFKVKLHLEKMNFLKAFLLGFIFSLGWSPCIGPMLANALMLAATNASGYIYVLSYGLGLIIPFLITGLLTSTVLNFVNKRKKIFKYVLTIAGIIMICFGGYMIYTSSRNIMDYKKVETDSNSHLLNYEFKDQNGNTIKLSDYEGKYIMLNFSTTWCTYCHTEIPEYLKFSENNDDVVCLYVMSPTTSNCSKEDLIQHAKENFELPVIIDVDDVLTIACPVQGYPTKYVLSPEGEILGYAAGGMSAENIENIMSYAYDKYENGQ